MASVSRHLPIRANERRAIKIVVVELGRSGVGLRRAAAMASGNVLRRKLLHERQAFGRLRHSADLAGQRMTR